jgi:AAA family ATP:ADP antiporter
MLQFYVRSIQQGTGRQAYRPGDTVVFSGSLETDHLMLIASVMLLLPIPLIFFQQGLKSGELNNAQHPTEQAQTSIGGNPFAGFKIFFTNP